MRVFARSFVCSFIHSFIQRMLTPSCYVQVAPGATRGAVKQRLPGENCHSKSQKQCPKGGEPLPFPPQGAHPSTDPVRRPDPKTLGLQRPRPQTPHEEERLGNHKLYGHLCDPNCD